MNYSLSEERSPLELFASGDSARAYEYFGAHLADGGVTFRVWAPNALSVSVVGSFNDWNRNSHFMSKLSNGVWELRIEGIEQGEIYKYCIETPWFEKILKSDPFAFYAELRPDNASIVRSLDGYEWGDGEWLYSRRLKNPLKAPLNIYEVHLGSWKRRDDGTFCNYRELADALVPYLLEMSYNYVQLMPIMEYPFDGSWGYQTTGYFAATSRYGEPQDLMYFVDRLHQAGIGVFVDWVPSNFPKDSFALIKFDGSALYENEDPKLGERPSWDTCLFNYSRPEVISFLVSSAVFWLDVYHFDGLRVGSLSSMLYLDYGKEDDEWEPNRYGGKENLEAIDFIKRMNSAVHLFFPEAIVFAEESTAWPKITSRIEEGGLGFDFKWNMGWMNDMLNYMVLPSQWRPFNHDNLTFSFFYAFSEHFLLPLSHDEVAVGRGALLSKMPGSDEDRFSDLRAFITYMYAHPGKKLVFMGIENGQIREWSYDIPVDWQLAAEECNSKLQRFFRDINSFYLDSRPLYELDTTWKGFDWIHHDDYTNSVIAFKRVDSDGNELLAVCNFRPVRHDNYTVGVPKLGIYDEVFSSDAAEYGGSGLLNGRGLRSEPMKIHGCNQGLSLALPPMGVIYLKCVQEL